MHHLLEALLENHTVQILSIGNQKALTHCVHNAKLFLKVLQQRRVWGLEMGETRWEHDTLYGLLEGMWPQHGERTTAVAFGFIDDRCGNDEKLIRRFKDITREQRRADKAARAAAVAAGRWLETPSAQWLDPANFYWISRSHMVTRFAWSPKQEAEFWRSQGYAVPLVKRNMQAHNPRAWSNPHIRQYSDMLPGGCDEATQTNKKWGTSRESATAAQVIAWLADDLPYPAFPGIDKIYWDIYTTPFIMAIRADGAAPASVKRLSCLLLEIGAEAWMRSRGRELDPSAAHTRGRRVTWQGDDAMYEQWSRGLAQLVLDDELGKLDGDVEARREAYRRLVRHAVWLWTSNLQETVEALWGGGGEEFESDEDEEWGLGALAEGLPHATERGKVDDEGLGDAMRGSAGAKLWNEEDLLEDLDLGKPAAVDNEEAEDLELVAAADNAGAAAAAAAARADAATGDDNESSDDGAFGSSMGEGGDGDLAVIRQLERHGHAYIAPSDGEDSLAVLSRTGTFDVAFYGNRMVTGLAADIAALQRRQGVVSRPVSVVELCTSSDEEDDVQGGGKSDAKRARMGGDQGEPAEMLFPPPHEKNGAAEAATGRSDGGGGDGDGDGSSSDLELEL